MSGTKSAVPDPKLILDEILALDLRACAVTVCLASVSKANGELKLQKLQITDDLTEDFRSVPQAVFAARRKDATTNDLELRPYDPGSKPEQHEVEFIDLAKHKSIDEQIALLSSLADLEVFTQAEEFVSGLRFYVIIVQCKGGEPLYCFRIYSQKKELSRSAFFAALFMEGHYDRVRDPVFLFDQHIDCFSKNGVAFILNKNNFQNIFRYFEMVLKTARATLKTIKARVPIYNFDDFQKACEGHFQMLAKLKNIAEKPYLDTITMTDIKKVMKEFPNLHVKIANKKGTEMLVFEPSNKWALLRLLDDDYLKSLMTGEGYEVTGKRVFD